MSHTRRIYNRFRIKKAQRYNVDDGTSTHLRIGIPLTQRSFLCMGRCKMCRDKNREPRLLRKRTKEQFITEQKQSQREMHPSQSSEKSEPNLAPAELPQVAKSSSGCDTLPDLHL